MQRSEILRKIKFKFLSAQRRRAPATSQTKKEK